MRAIFVAALIIGGCAMPPEQGLTPAAVLKADHFIEVGVIGLRNREPDRAEAAFYLAQQLGGGAAAVDGRGCAEYLRGNYAQAERLFESANRIQPGYPRALAHLALLADRRGDAKAAERLYESVLKKDPEDYRARNDYAVMLLEQGGRFSAARARDELTQAEIISGAPEVKHNLEIIND